jgi:hypothetical protein
VVAVIGVILKLGFEHDRACSIFAGHWLVITLPGPMHLPAPAGGYSGRSRTTHPPTSAAHHRISFLGRTNRSCHVLADPDGLIEVPEVKLARRRGSRLWTNEEYPEFQLLAAVAWEPYKKRTSLELVTLHDQVHARTGLGEDWYSPRGAVQAFDHGHPDKSGNASKQPTAAKGSGSERLKRRLKFLCTDSPACH